MIEFGRWAAQKQSLRKLIEITAAALAKCEAKKIIAMAFAVPIVCWPFS